MIAILRGFIKSIPTLILCVALAVAVWISAVNATDPVDQRLYPRRLTIERVGQDASLVITGEIPSQATVTLSAPLSVWGRMLSDKSPVRVWINLAGFGPGTHNIEVHIDPLIDEPVKVISASPRTILVTLEKLVTQDFLVRLVRRGEPAIGFQTETPSLSQEKVVISGPASQVEKIKDVRVVLDLTQASDTINRALDVQVLDATEAEVNGVTITPAQVMVGQPVTQRGGYRNVVIKVASTGQVAGGYRLTNISVFPPTVTVFASDPLLVDRLPGYVETSPLDLTGVKDDIDIRLPLNLPNGVQVVGDQTVMVQVGVAAIEGSITLSGLRVQVDGIGPDFSARISPETIDVIISGPVPLLDQLTEQEVRVALDVAGAGAGTYQFAPRVTVSIAELQVESILPSSIEVVVEIKSTPTPTPTATVRPTATPGR